jgi:hypothetical protein
MEHADDVLASLLLCGCAIRTRSEMVEMNNDDGE